MCDTSRIELLTLAEVSKKLRMHKSTVSRHIKSGELVCCRIGGRKLVTRSDLKAFIDNSKGVDNGNPGTKGDM